MMNPHFHTDFSISDSLIFVRKSVLIMRPLYGISIQDLDLLTIGMVNDMYAESSNDNYKGYAQIATQRDFDAF